MVVDHAHVECVVEASQIIRVSAVKLGAQVADALDDLGNSVIREGFTGGDVFSFTAGGVTLRGSRLI